MLFQAESLNSAAGCDAPWVCVNGWLHPKVALNGVPVSNSTLPLLAARDMKNGTFAARSLSSAYTLICSSFWLLLRTTRWYLDSLKCNYESVGLDSGHEFICTWQRAFNFSSPTSLKPLFRASPHSHLLIIRSQLHETFSSGSIASEDKCALKKNSGMLILFKAKSPTGWQRLILSSAG